MAIPPGHTALAGSERPRPASHSLVGPVDADEVIGITLILRQPLPSLDDARAVQPGRRRFLSPAECAENYGATDADLDAVTAFAGANGLAVIERHAGRRSVTLKGSALSERPRKLLSYVSSGNPGSDWRAASADFQGTCGS
jgi:hypothetical protein